MRLAMTGVLALILAAAILLFYFGRPTTPSTFVVAQSKAARSPSLHPNTLPPASPGVESPPAPVVAPSVPPLPNGTPADRTGGVVWTKVEEQILELTNEERRKAGLRPLEREDGLCLTARSHSADMVARNFFDHVNPSKENPSDRIERMHRRLVGEAGENLWEGTGAKYVADPELGATIVLAWMNSPHHRENILRPSFNRLGVGVAIVGNEVKATQNFSEEKAYLRTALPTTIDSGTTVDLDMAPGSPPAEMFDLEPTGKHTGKPKGTPIANAKIVAEPGDYRVRFYFSEGAGSFAIYDGPRITVTSTAPGVTSR